MRVANMTCWFKYQCLDSNLRWQRADEEEQKRDGKEGRAEKGRQRGKETERKRHEGKERKEENLQDQGESCRNC